MTNRSTRWILIRGLIREEAHWHDFPELFQQRFPEARLEFLDLPGNGRHFEQRTPGRVEAMARVMQQSFRELRWDNDQPRYILAMSLGAMVTYQWLLDRPRDFDGAVLCNTSFRGLSPFFHRMRPQNLAGIVKNLFVSDPLERQLRTLALTSNRRAIHREVAGIYARVQDQRPVSRMNFLRQVLAGSRYHFQFRRPSRPVLLLSSKMDTLVDPRCSLALSDALGAPLAQHPTANHDLALDDPLWIIERIACWLDGTLAD